MTAPTPLSISDATTWSQGFLRREWRLVLPVALATMALPAAAVALFVPEIAVPPGADIEAAYASFAQAMQVRLMAMVPLLICVMLGGLAISALVLTPGISVGEALRLGARRLPKLIGASLLVAAIAVAAAVVVALVLFTIVGVPAPGARAQSSAATTLMFVTMMAVSARFCLLTPLAADSGPGPIAAVRRSFALSRGHFWRLLALLTIMMVATVVIPQLIQLAIGTVLLLVGKLTGLTGVAETLLAIIGACLGAAAYMLLWVMLAAVYRQLSSRAI